MTADSTPLWVSVVGFLGIIAGFLYTWFRDSRARKWAKEDAALLATELQAKQKISELEIASRVLKESDKLSEQITDAAQSAKDAYAEANSINHKIAALHEEIKLLIERRSRIGSPQDRKPENQRKGS